MVTRKAKEQNKWHIYQINLTRERYRDLRIVSAMEFCDMAEIVNDALDVAIARLKRKHAAQEAKTMAISNSNAEGESSHGWTAQEI